MSQQAQMTCLSVFSWPAYPILVCLEALVTSLQPIVGAADAQAGQWSKCDCFKLKHHTWLYFSGALAPVVRYLYVKTILARLVEHAWFTQAPILCASAHSAVKEYSAKKVLICNPKIQLISNWLHPFQNIKLLNRASSPLLLTSTRFWPCRWCQGTKAFATQLKHVWNSLLWGLTKWLYWRT